MGHTFLSVYRCADGIRIQIQTYLTWDDPFLKAAALHQSGISETEPP